MSDEIKVDDTSDYDYYNRRGVFHKCNGFPPELERGSGLAADAYFDGYDGNEVKIDNGPLLEIEWTPPTTLRFVYTERVGEVEGVFDDEGNLLDFWCCNDATWRNEYFSGFMATLGFDCVSSSDENLINRLCEAASDAWGVDIEP